MRKLTQRERNGLIRRYESGEKISALAARYQVSRPTIYKEISDYNKWGRFPVEKKPGRKKTELSNQEKEIILKSQDECTLGAIGLEVYIEKNHGIHIPHNKIHAYLLSQGRAVESIKKKRQRKYCRYQRDHSMTLWHTDWKEFYLNGEKKYVIIFIDDRSRYVTCYGVFDKATTENTLKVLRSGIEAYGCPDQIITDNGTQFCSLHSDSPGNHGFERFLQENEIKHIRSRVCHPQTNGKAERFFKEIDARIDKLGSIDGIVEWQNTVKPHKSLGGKTPEYVFWNALRPERVLNYVSGWFWSFDSS